MHTWFHSHPSLPKLLRDCFWVWLSMTVVLIAFCVYHYGFNTVHSTQVIKLHNSSTVSGLRDEYRLGLRNARGPTTDISLFTLFAFSALFAVLGWKIRRVQLRTLLPWAILLLLVGIILTLIYLLNVVLFQRWVLLNHTLWVVLSAVVPAIVMLIYSARYRVLWQEVTWGNVEVNLPVARAIRTPRISWAALVLAVYGGLCVLVPLIMMSIWISYGNAMGVNTLMLTASLSVTNYLSFLTPFFDIHQFLLGKMNVGSGTVLWPQLICVCWGLYLLSLAWRLYRYQLPSLMFLCLFMYGSMGLLTLYTVLGFIVSMGWFLALPNLLFPGCLVLLLPIYLLRDKEPYYQAEQLYQLHRQAKLWRASQEQDAQPEA